MIASGLLLCCEFTSFVLCIVDSSKTHFDFLAWYERSWTGPLYPNMLEWIGRLDTVNSLGISVRLFRIVPSNVSPFSYKCVARAILVKKLSHVTFLPLLWCGSTSCDTTRTPWFLSTDAFPLPPRQLRANGLSDFNHNRARMWEKSSYDFRENRGWSFV